MVNGNGNGNGRCTCWRQSPIYPANHNQDPYNVGPLEAAAGAELQWWRNLAEEQLVTHCKRWCWRDRGAPAPAWSERRWHQAIAMRSGEGVAHGGVRSTWRWCDAAAVLSLARERRRTQTDTGKERRRRRRRRRGGGGAACRWCCVGGQEAQ
ncbi:hypothetical protein JCGZ_00153 [Jatropha curcas]|uniref:Uncharacterized protein n=1 Tax=Jatropha curcas TaxID=180498 RepID=A0A067JW77_JATCU|nr:hypothetical protein JCGZ_00153 [Jatropha curcas]